jgi:hypothetical protein
MAAGRGGADYKGEAGFGVGYSRRGGGLATANHSLTWFQVFARRLLLLRAKGVNLLATEAEKLRWRVISHASAAPRPDAPLRSLGS